MLGGENLVVVEVLSAYWGITSVKDIIVVWRIHHYTDISLPMALNISAYFQVFLLCLKLIFIILVHSYLCSALRTMVRHIGAPFSFVSACHGQFIVDGVDLLGCRGVLPFINQLT